MEAGMTRQRVEGDTTMLGLVPHFIPLLSEPMARWVGSGHSLIGRTDRVCGQGRTVEIRAGAGLVLGGLCKKQWLSLSEAPLPGFSAEPTLWGREDAHNPTGPAGPGTQCQ